MVSSFVAETREAVARGIRQDAFPADTVESACMCKFVATGFGADAVAAARKVLGARALQEASALGVEAFLPLATCAAEGDNTIMELKVVRAAARIPFPPRTPTPPPRNSHAAPRGGAATPHGGTTTEPRGGAATPDGGTTTEHVDIHAVAATPPRPASAEELRGINASTSQVQDLVRGRTPKVPLGLLARAARCAAGRQAASAYLGCLAKATVLGRRALDDGQLLRDLAWARAHLKIIAHWLDRTSNDPPKRAWLDSYARVLLRFPTPYQA